MAKVGIYNWKGHLELNISIMKIMGLWPSDQTFKPDLYMFFSAVMVLLCVLCHVLSQVINIYFVCDNLEAVAGIIYVILIEIMGGIKTFLLIKNMKIVKGRVDVLNNEWFQPKSKKQMLLIQADINMWRTVYRSFLFMTFAGCAFYAFYPFMDSLSDGQKRFPMVAWYPYDAQKSPYYEITFIFQVISTTYLSLVHANVDTFISGFNVFIGCQFDMLCDNLRNFSEVNNNCSGIVAEKFIRCVIYHKKILSFLEECSKFFNWVMIWHLIISGVAIGITMFQLTLVEPYSSEFTSLLVYGSAIISEIFLYCYFGNEVTIKSNLLSYAAFESDWTNLPNGIKKNLLIFTMNVWRPVKLSALNIFELSLETFMNILKTAWSYFALLYQLSGGN